MLADFSLQDLRGKVRFLEGTFLLDDTSMEVDLGILFLSFSDADMGYREGVC